MSLLLTSAAVIACVAGLLDCDSNWYCLCLPLRTKRNQSQNGFIGGILVYGGATCLLGEGYGHLAYAAFILDASYPALLIGLFYKG